MGGRPVEDIEILLAVDIVPSLETTGSPASPDTLTLSIHRSWQTPSQLAVSASKAGRNAPCPCGSGRNSKKCFGTSSATVD